MVSVIYPNELEYMFSDFIDLTLPAYPGICALLVSSMTGSNYSFLGMCPVYPGNK